MHYPPDTQVTFKPDNRVFASYPMPAKIDLINEKPRFENEVEQQLSSRISPTFQLQPQRQSLVQDGSMHHQQQQHWPQHQQQQQQQQQQHHQQQDQQSLLNTQQQHYQTQHQTSRQFTDEWSNEPKARQSTNYAAELTADLAKKEARLREEIDALQRRPYSPHVLPSKIDITSETQRTRSYQSGGNSPRPLSAASSNRSSTYGQDLASKEADLMKEIAELEQKPYNPQRILVEHEKWYEYPEGHPEYRQLADTKRRVKDFCSLPSHLYPEGGSYIHEENLSTSLIGGSSSSRNKSTSPLSMHTAIIKSPKREIDNRSPLPFAFDNFSTGGIKGNIATVGAVEPERPYPPINPIIVKRTPTPN